MEIKLKCYKKTEDTYLIPPVTSINLSVKLGKHFKDGIVDNVILTPPKIMVELDYLSREEYDSFEIDKEYIINIKENKMEQTGCIPTAKKSLINSYESLNNKLERLRDVAQLAEELTKKFDRTQDRPEKTQEVQKSNRPEFPDIVDIFNELGVKLDNLTDRIGKNVEHVLNMVE